MNYMPIMRCYGHIIFHPRGCNYSEERKKAQIITNIAIIIREMREACLGKYYKNLKGLFIRNALWKNWWHLNLDLKACLSGFFLQ